MSVCFENYQSEFNMRRDSVTWPKKEATFIPYVAISAIKGRICFEL